MQLTKEQIEALRKQLIEQVQHLPDEKKEEAIKEIETLSDGAIEQMYIEQITEKKKDREETIFRMIVNGTVKSIKIDENSKAIAVLDINPISDGHTLIIPLEKISSIKELPSEAFALAKKLAKRIMNRLKADSVNIKPEIKFEEAIIELIPFYKDKIESKERKKATNEELEITAKKLRPQKKNKIKEKNKREENQKNESHKIPMTIQ